MKKNYISAISNCRMLWVHKNVTWSVLLCPVLFFYTKLIGVISNFGAPNLRNSNVARRLTLQHWEECTAVTALSRMHCSYSTEQNALQLQHWAECSAVTTLSRMHCSYSTQQNALQVQHSAECPAVTALSRMHCSSEPEQRFKYFSLRWQFAGFKSIFLTVDRSWLHPSFSLQMVTARLNKNDSKGFVLPVQTTIHGPVLRRD